VLLIGSGPIVIGQACEFDYSGTQAVKALREEGLRLILVNSNPATIMTDPELADRTYVEPMTLAVLTKIIERERPDALLPTVGGQTALVVIDLQNAFMLPGMPVEVPTAREIVPNVNKLAAATRAAGGKVVWIKMCLEGQSEAWRVFFDGDPRRATLSELTPGS